MSDEPVVGCERCWPLEAEAAWAARSALKCEADLIDESHFHVMILACGVCTQRFVSVFTETIDWSDGDDPQNWMLVPLSNAEAAELVRRGSSLSEPELNALPARRCLECDHPKGGMPSHSWRQAFWVNNHD